MAKSKGVGLTVLYVLIAVLLAYLWLTRREGFDGTADVPDSCGKYGWTYSKGIIQLVKDFLSISSAKEEYVTQVIDSITKYRHYTPADCKSVGGLYAINNGQSFCYQVKNLADGIANGNATGWFDLTCAGLNKQSTSPPQECYINKQVVGKPNVEFTVHLDKYPLKVESGTVMLYTKDECTKLGGAFIDSNVIKKENDGLSVTKWIARQYPFLSKLKEKDVNAALSANGYDKGMCLKGDVVLNAVCAAGNTTFSKVADSMSSGLHGIYNYVSSG